jgi:TRAP-type C4-dicarboxylate transport system permease small subunit
MLPAKPQGAELNHIPKIARSVLAISRTLLAFERRLLILLVATIAMLILANVATRYAGRAIFWIDELAVYLMVAMCFIGVPMTMRQRVDFAVTLVTDSLPTGLSMVWRPVLTSISIGYAVLLCWLCWRMYDPISFAGAGFSPIAFAETKHNFVYLEQTPTLGISKAIVYLPLPWFALSSLVHAMANLVEDIYPQLPRPISVVGSADRPVEGA